MNNRDNTLPRRPDAPLAKSMKKFPVLKRAVAEILRTKDEAEQVMLLRRAFWAPATITYLDAKGNRYTEPNRYALSDKERSELAWWIPSHPISIEWQCATRTNDFLIRKFHTWDFLPEDVPFLLKNKQATTGVFGVELFYMTHFINPETTMLAISKMDSEAISATGVIPSLLEKLERAISDFESFDYDEEEDWLEDDKQYLEIKAFAKALYKRTREILGLDESIPDSWVKYILDGGAKSA